MLLPGALILELLLQAGEPLGERFAPLALGRDLGLGVVQRIPGLREPMLVARGFAPRGRLGILEPPLEPLALIALAFEVGPSASHRGACLGRLPVEVGPRGLKLVLERLCATPFAFELQTRALEGIGRGAGPGLEVEPDRVDLLLGARTLTVLVRQTRPSLVQA